MAYVPKVGDRVFLRSNEPDPLVVGQVVRLENFNGKSLTSFAVVKDEKTGKEWMGGTVHPYEANLHADLELLQPIEQWNYLMANKKYPFLQIAEKYGVKYKTF